MNNPQSEVKCKRKEFRRLVADYMQSEGCSCCRNEEAHDIAKEALAKMLQVPRYSDNSGYNFNKFATEPV